MSKMETKCVQAGYDPGNGAPRVVPVVQSTTYKYSSVEEVGDLFDLKADGYFYTRLANPTCAALEEKMAALEGGVGALYTSSGQAASLFSILNIASAGDRIVSSVNIYGGTFNLFNVTLRKLGIDVDFVDVNDLARLEKAIVPGTKAVFAETIANPALTVADIEAIAAVAHRHGVPLIVDNTFATPALCRPIEWGADIVVHSTSKYADGHAVALGGIIVDGGTFDWAGNGYTGLSAPDESYHGLSYTETFGKSAYIVKARVQLMRDMGAAPAPMNAFLTNLGLETLHLRMERHSENALKVARFLQTQKLIKTVKYPALEGDEDYERAGKYLGGKGSGVITFEVATRDQAVKFMNALRLAKIVVHVADVRTGVLHPASSTHRQLTDRQLVEAGIGPGTIRLSVGIENVDDIIADLAGALKAAE